MRYIAFIHAQAREINVDTHNHVVTLNGTFGSQVEKDRAIAVVTTKKNARQRELPGTESRIPNPKSRITSPGSRIPDP